MIKKSPPVLLSGRGFFVERRSGRYSLTSTDIHTVITMLNQMEEFKVGLEEGTLVVE